MFVFRDLTAAECVLLLAWLRALPPTGEWCVLV